MKITPDSVENHNALKSGLDTIDHQKLTEIVEAAAQKEAAMGKDGAPHHLAELELLARAQKDWYYAMMSYIMGGQRIAVGTTAKQGDVKVNFFTFSAHIVKCVKPCGKTRIYSGSSNVYSF